MTWRAWSLIDWNRALVNEIFLDQERVSSPISRISASNRVLQKCTGDTECQPEEVRQAFIAAFGRTAGEVRKRFRWTDRVKADSTKEKIPSVFAPLYLTLLAASADEATYNEGNFRRRFAELVQPFDIPNLECSDLPQLWAYVRDWSLRRHRREKDCRLLHLPAVPDHEKLIGYSKRLAFPAYRDEVILSSVLAEWNLDGNSGFEVVARAVYSRYSRFTAGFVEELDQFRNLVASGQALDAYQTPFWGAVRDITWERRRQEIREIGRFALDADFSDPGYPSLTLLADEAGSKTLSPHCETTAFPIPGNYRYLVRALNGKPCTPSAVLSLAQATTRLKHVKLWRDLAAGCVSMFTDEYGNLRSDANYCDDSAACFLVKEGLGGLIRRRAIDYGLKPSRSILPGLPQATWEVVLFESISRGSLMGLVRDLPEQVQAGLGLAWNPSRPAVSGAARYGQALLLNPASNPVVRMPGAESGKYELLDSRGETVEQGKLVEAEGGAFQIPNSALLAGATATKVRISLIDSVGREGELDVPLVQVVPLVQPTNLPDPTAWLVDGPAGQLSSFAPTTGHLQSDRPVAMRDDKPRRFHPRFTAQPELGSWSEVGVSSVDDIAPFLHWLCEALSLRFRSRASLPFKDLRFHVNGAADAAGVSHWLTTRLLLGACWLSAVAHRTSPYSLVTLAPRTIAIFRDEPRPVGRIVGMLAQSERAKLQSLLHRGESAYRLTCGSTEIGLGAIELQLDTASRIRHIADSLGLEILSRDTFGAPLASGVAVLPSSDALPRNRNLVTAEKWDGREWKEYSLPAGLETAGTLVRVKGVQRYTHWIAAGNGGWKTNSRAWAWLFRATALESPAGTIASNGDCKLGAQLREMPPSFARWWMHWGGGCVSMSDDGCLVFGGGPGMLIWKELGQWVAYPDIKSTLGRAWAVPMERRRLALRLRRMRRAAGGQDT